MSDQQTITFNVASVVFFAGELGRFTLEPHADEHVAKEAMVGAILDLDRTSITIDGKPATAQDVFIHVVTRKGRRATVMRDFFRYGAVVSVDFHK